MNERIAEAIRKGKLIRFMYDGEIRIVEPHCYGQNHKGSELLRAFQTDGGSISGESVEWKMFSVSKISALEITEQTFSQPRPGFNPNGDRNMTRIFAIFKGIINEHR